MSLIVKDKNKNYLAINYYFKICILVFITRFLQTWTNTIVIVTSKSDPFQFTYIYIPNTVPWELFRVYNVTEWYIRTTISIYIYVHKTQRTQHRNCFFHSQQLQQQTRLAGCSFHIGKAIIRMDFPSVCELNFSDRSNCLQCIGIIYKEHYICVQFL